MTMRQLEFGIFLRKFCYLGVINALGNCLACLLSLEYIVRSCLNWYFC